MEYMQGASELWTKYKMPDTFNSTAVASPNIQKPKVTIVFTTESSEIVNHQVDFSQTTELQERFPYNFSFVRNDQDVLPGSGWIKDTNHNVTADDKMISVLMAIKFQLFPSAGMGNCCSNLHTLFYDLLEAGLGAAPKFSFDCLQDFENPALRR